MNVFKVFGPLLDALKYGRELNNSLVWKDRQSNVNMLFGLLSAIAALLAAAGYDFHITAENLMSIAGGISALGVSVFNWYMTKATSARMGKDGVPTQAEVAEKASRDAGV